MADTELIVESGAGTLPHKDFKWLGPLKRTLSYTDEDESDYAASEISEDDRVVIDEIFARKIFIRDAERLRSILSQVASELEAIATEESSSPEAADTEEEKKEGPESVSAPSSDAELTACLLLKIRDIINGRVDLSRVLIAMVGLDFLLGCACEQDTVPKPIRSACLAILICLSEGVETWNLSIQYKILKEARLERLCTLFFEEEKRDEDADGVIRGQIIRVISACLFGHKVAEKKFSESENSRSIIESGLGVTKEGSSGTPPPASLRRSSLFFLKNLLLSNSTSERRVDAMRDCFVHVMHTSLVPQTEPEGSVRKMALEMLMTMMRRNLGRHLVVEEADSLMTMGDKRVSEIINLGKDEREAMNYELRLWQRLMGEILSAS